MTGDGGDVLVRTTGEQDGAVGFDCTPQASTEQSRENIAEREP